MSLESNNCTADASMQFIQPALLIDVSLESRVMQEEIFGPILSIFTWNNDEDIYRIVERDRDPLTL